MEYEIGDDPQGLPDRPEGHRDGGVREDRVFFRKQRPTKRPLSQERNVPLEQMGETA